MASLSPSEMSTSESIKLLNVEKGRKRKEMEEPHYYEQLRMSSERETENGRNVKKKRQVVTVKKSKKEKKKGSFLKRGFIGIKNNLKSFAKSDIYTKLQAGLQALILLAVVPLIGLSGKILQQTSQDPVANDMNTSSSIMEFAEQVNTAIEQVLGKGNVTSNALVELANQVIAINMELNEQTNDIINETQRTGVDIDNIQSLALQERNKLNNKSLKFNELVKSTAVTINRLNNITATLSIFSNNSASSTEVISDLLTVVNELARIQNVTDQLVKGPMSCKDIKLRLPNSITGYYFINNRTIYCNMDELCGSGGGWTRLAYLDMSDATQNCTSGFEPYQSEGVRACGRPVTNSGSCVSVQFPSNGISYSQICGRVTGYQYYSSDAFNVEHINNINAPYVDGVSITRGSPRQHVWTMANDPTDSYNNNPQWMCPCVSGSTQTVPSFVGSHYFCESGNNASTWTQILYTSDPLWDGQGCGSIESSCCNVPGIPWFHRDYGSNTTTDYIELRVCGDEGTSNEDSPVGFYEIYIK